LPSSWSRPFAFASKRAGSLISKPSPPVGSSTIATAEPPVARHIGQRCSVKFHRIELQGLRDGGHPVNHENNAAQTYSKELVHGHNRGLIRPLPSSDPSGISADWRSAPDHGLDRCRRKPAAVHVHMTVSLEFGGDRPQRQPLSCLGISAMEHFRQRHQLGVHFLM
jgi:hypothetical protein